MLIALTPEAWEQVWWLAAMTCCAVAMRRTGWWHGAVSALLLMPQAGTALPLFVIALAAMPRCEDEREAARGV